MWSVELQPPQHGILRVAVFVGPPGSPFPLVFAPDSASSSSSSASNGTASEDSSSASGPPSCVLQCRVVAGEPSRATSTVFGKGLGVGAVGSVVAGEKADVNVCLRDGQGFPIYTAGQLADDLALKFAFASEAAAFDPSSLPSARLQHVAGCYFQAIYTPPAHPSSRPYTLSISVLLSSRPIAFRSFPLAVVPQPPASAPLQPSALAALSALTGRQLANGFTARVPLVTAGSAKDSGSGSFEFAVRLFDSAGTVVSQADDTRVALLATPSASLSPDAAAASAAADGNSSRRLASGLSMSLTRLGDLLVSFTPAAAQRYTLLFWLPAPVGGEQASREAAQAVGWVFVQGVPGGWIVNVP